MRRVWGLIAGVTLAMVGFTACAPSHHHAAQLAAPAGPDMARLVQQPDSGAAAPAGGDDVEPTVAAPPAVAAQPAISAAAVQPEAAPEAGRAAAPVSPGQAWAVVIGIGPYAGSTHPTYGGTGDAAAFNTALRQAGWPADHILSLTDSAATAGNMRNAMQWLVDRSTTGSFSVFHYSGHVRQTGSHSEWLWPYDNAWISDTDFAGYMTRLRGRAWIDVSGCESAGFDKGVSSPTRLFTSSSRENEKSYEVPDWRQSVWTGFEIQQGMLDHAADRRHTGHVSIQQAADYGATNAPAYTSNQQPYGPQHPYIAGGDGADWYLDFPTAPPPPPRASNPAPLPGSPPPSSPPGTAPSTPPQKDPCANITLGVVHCGG